MLPAMNVRLGLLHARRLSSCGAAAAGGSRVKAKRNILDLSFEEMAGEMVKLSQPHYRARQLWTFIYSKLGTSFDHVPSFPSSLKQQARSRALCREVQFRFRNS